MTQCYQIIVVGSGLSGSVAARLLAQEGYRVLVVEQKKHIAGQCFDYKNEHNITVHKYGPHIFHTQDKGVWDFLNCFTSFDNYQHRVLSYAEGQLFPFPINRTTLNQVFGRSLSDKEVEPFLNSLDRTSQGSVEPNFESAIIDQVGNRLYDLFFKHYTEKQWECDPKDLAVSLAGRIPLRHNTDDRYFSDKYQGMPTKGYVKMVENILNHPNISVLLNCNYFDICSSIKDALLTVYTAPLDTFFDYAHGKLKYRSVRIELETLLQDEYQSCSVINYPNDYDFTRITEFKKLTSECVSGATTICREYPLLEGEPFYVVPDQENTTRREQYMEMVAQAEANDKMLFLGRLAQYKYYNMDAAVRAAMDRTTQWIQSCKK